MFRKIKFALILATFAGLCGCGFMSDDLSGEFEGTTRLSRVYYNSDIADPLKTGTGRISFPFPSTLRFGSNTPLPDCNLALIETSETEYSIDFSTQYKGESNDGNGCQALLAGSPAFRADIYKGKLRREANGDIVVKVEFQPRDSTGSTLYELEFRGSKKGWF